MKERNNNRGFTLVELMIVIGVIAILMGLVVTIGPMIQESARNTTCISNLQSNIYSQLTIYKQRYGRYPDESGDLFLASLYYTKIVTFEDAKDVFICPTDAADDDAVFTEAIAKNIGLMPRREDDPDPKDDWDEDTVPPNGISYAARYNWNPEDGPHPEEEWYDVGQDPTDESVPLVCDDDEDKSGKLSDDDFDPIHGDHYNVLWSGGKVKALTEKVRVGEPGTVLEPLRN